MPEIVIRHVEPTDAQAVQQLFAHQSVYSDTLQLPYPSLTVWQKRVGELPPGVTSLVACIDGEIVGQLGLEVFQNPRRRHVATFGLGVSPTATRQGVASKLMAAMIDLCDNWLNIQRIELTVYSDNPAAVGLYKKFGFEEEGFSRRFAYRDGKYVDVLHMARFKTV